MSTLSDLALEAADLYCLALESFDPAPAGPAADPVGDLLRGAMAHGAGVLHRITGPAVRRLLQHAPAGPGLFSPHELGELADALAEVLATSELLGRALVRDQQRRAEARHAARESADDDPPSLDNADPPPEGEGADPPAGPEGGAAPSLDVPTVIQDEDYDCGAACLRAVLAFWGIRDSEAHLVRELGTSPRDGTSAKAIIGVARSAGLEAEAREGLSLADLAHVTTRGTPVICCCQMYGGGHWVVVCGVQRDEVRLMDPVNGGITVPAAKWLAGWTDTGADGRRYDRYGIAVGKPARESEDASGHEHDESGRFTGSSGGGKVAAAVARHKAAAARHDAAADRLLAGASRRLAAARVAAPREYAPALDAAAKALDEGRFGKAREIMADVRGALPAWHPAAHHLAHAGGHAFGAARARLRADSAREDARTAPARMRPSRESLLLEALAEPPAPLAPEEAIHYFLSLVPTLGIDPQRFGAQLRRKAFTLAVATGEELLDHVKGIIAGALQSGKAFRAVPRDIGAVLDQAGVTPANPQYAEMVFRTNAMDAYNAGADAERMGPDVIGTFPVWRYSNPHDGRSRPEHAARDGNYYPAAVPFVQVRGTGPEDACNCRCTMIPVDKWDWADLRAKGTRLAAGYGD